MGHTHNHNPGLRAPSLMVLAALLTGVLACHTARPVEMRRFDFARISGRIPGWSEGGSLSSRLAAGRLNLPPGSKLSRAIGVSDYPLQVHLEVQLAKGPSALVVVTRAADDVMGPLGLPSRGVAFVLWDESVFERRPFNAEVLRIEGDRLIPLGRERCTPLGDSVTIDVYDDGEWVLFGVNGEVVVAREPSLATVCRLCSDPMWMPTVVRHLWQKVSPPERLPAPRTGDLVLASPLVHGDAEISAAVTDLALVLRAPAKSVEERARWEDQARERPLRWPRPIHGHLCDASTRRPIAGAVLTPEGTGRTLPTDDFGEFVETQAPLGDPRDWAMTLNHPDYPAVTLSRDNPGEFTSLNELLDAEGEGVLTLRLESGGDVPSTPRLVTLRPEEEGRLPRHHLTPPPHGPLVFGQLPAGRWRVEVDFGEPGRPLHRGEPFEITGAPDQTRTESLSD
jgi:hypothetical protein